MHQLIQQRGRCQTSVPSPRNRVCKVGASSVGLLVTWNTHHVNSKQGSGVASEEKEARSMLF